jgi:hypothetical protein
MPFAGRVPLTGSTSAAIRATPPQPFDDCPPKGVAVRGGPRSNSDRAPSWFSSSGGSIRGPRERCHPRRGGCTGSWARSLRRQGRHRHQRQHDRSARSSRSRRRTGPAAAYPRSPSLCGQPARSPSLACRESPVARASSGFDEIDQPGQLICPRTSPSRASGCGPMADALAEAGLPAHYIDAAMYSTTCARDQKLS